MLQPNKYFFLVLAMLLLVLLLVAIAFGAVTISTGDMYAAVSHWLHGDPPGNIREGVFLQIRLPRVLLCAITGAILSASGV